VVVTHEHDLAQRFSERIITIDHGAVVADDQTKGGGAF